MPKRKAWAYGVIVCTALLLSGWTGEDESHYYIEAPGYKALLDKNTGLCEFQDVNQSPVLQYVADTYIGFRGGRSFSGLEYNDEAWLTALQYPACDVVFTQDADHAELSVTRESPQAEFLNTYSFNRTSSRVIATSRITYRQKVDITNEAMHVGILGALHTGWSKKFDYASLANGVQVDPHNQGNGWIPLSNSTVVGSPSGLNEGGGSAYLTVNDDFNGISDYPGMFRSYSLPGTSPSGRVMSCWVYPETRVRFLVVITSGGVSASTYTAWFEPGQWSQFLWDFGKQGVTASSGLIYIYVKDNGSCFDGPQAKMFIDDVRISDGVEEGFFNAADGSKNEWCAPSSSQVQLDGGFYLQGNASLKWSNINLTETRALQIYTTAMDSKADPALPVDLSPYQYLSFAVYSEFPVSLTVRVVGASPGSATRYRQFTIPPRSWTPVRLDFKKDYLSSGGSLDLKRVGIYQILVNADGRNSARLWIDNFSLRGPSSAEIFDSQASDYADNGRGVLYSARRFRLGPGVLIHGDSMGATGIEAMEIDPLDQTLKCFMRRVDFHNVVASVNRNGYETYPTMTRYKEQTRMPGEQVTGSVVFDFSPSPVLEVVKARYPRNFKMGYSISDDDIYYSATSAFFCGTDDVLSPEYGKRGVLGNNLMISKNSWYWLPSADKHPYHTNPALVQLMDLLYSRGIEIAMHTAGSVANNRAQTIPALDDFVSRYGLRSWVDHSSPDNPEDFCRMGFFKMVNANSNDTPGGYYMLDLIKERNIDFVWVNSAFNYQSGSPNLYANPSPNTFLTGFPLPHTNQMLGTNAAGRPIWAHMRAYGIGQAEFFTPGGGGDIHTLEQLIGTEALVIPFTHDHIGFSHKDQNGFTVINDEMEHVFAWLKSKQDSGVIWVDTVSNILEWLVNWENVVITDQRGNLLTIENRNAHPVEGLTLRVLDDRAIKAVRCEDRYQIYVDDNRVVLPSLSANQSLTLSIHTGEYDKSLPRLSHVDAHVAVLSAEYDPATQRISIVLANSTSHDVMDKSITIENVYSDNVDLRDNGQQFAFSQAGQLYSTGGPERSISLKDNSLTVTWSTLGRHAITIEPRVGLPQPVVPDFNHDGFVDELDLVMFTACQTGPHLRYDPFSLPAGCDMLPRDGIIDADRDGDGDVDSEDFAQFQRCWSGTMPVDPQCM